jgi:glucosamine--fructose-6-phosphate aminotransferase (isomerizing)
MVRWCNREGSKGQVMDKEIETIRWTPEMAQKGVMIILFEEIHEQPEPLKTPY